MTNLKESRTLRCEILTDLSDVVDISAEWDELLERSSCHRVFSSCAWFIGACRSEDGVWPLVIVARRGDSIAGVFPLVLCNDRKEGGFPSPLLSDYNDMVVEDNDVDAASSLLAHALSGAAPISRLVLCDLRPDANCLRALTSMAGSSCISESCTDSVCHYVPLAGGFDRFLMARSRRFRKHLHQAERKASANRIVVQELDPARFASSRLPETFLTLHLERIPSHSCHQSPAVQKFVAEVLPPLFAARKLRALALFERDRVTAISLCFMGCFSLCNWNGGFLPDAAKWSPGNLLIAGGIRLACALNLPEYDFLRGAERYKESWGTGRRLLQEIRITIV